MLVDNKPLPLQALRFKVNHRDFKAKATIRFTSPLTFLTGHNGAGKTTILDQIFASAFEQPLSRRGTSYATLILGEGVDGLGKKDVVKFDAQTDSTKHLPYFREDGDFAYHINMMKLSSGQSLINDFHMMINKAHTEDAKLILLDEPERGLSCAHQIQIGLLLGMIGLTDLAKLQVVCATHSELVMEGAQSAQMLMLEQGRVVVDGIVADVLPQFKAHMQEVAMLELLRTIGQGSETAVSNVKRLHAKQVQKIRADAEKASAAKQKRDEKRAAKAQGDG
jgi:predicted ATPase